VWIDLSVAEPLENEPLWKTGDESAKRRWANFFLAEVSASAALIPAQSTTAFAVEVFAIGAVGLLIEILRQRMFELCPEFYGLSEATIHSPSRAPSRGSPHFRRLRAAICSYLDAEMGRIKQ
jgi:hypothetical protein